MDSFIKRQIMGNPAGRNSTQREHRGADGERIAAELK